MNKQEQIRKLQQIYLERARATHEQHVQGPTDSQIKQLEKGLSIHEQIKARLHAAQLYLREMVDFDNKTISSKIEKEIRLLELMDQNPNKVQEFINNTRSPKHNEISELKIVEPGHGFFLGRTQYDEELGQSVPYNIVTENLKTYENAKNLLNKAHQFQDIIKDINEGNLKVISESLIEREDEDPYNRLKAALINDHLHCDRKPKKKLVEEHTFGIER